MKFFHKTSLSSFILTKIMMGSGSSKKNGRGLILLSVLFASYCIALLHFGIINLFQQQYNMYSLKVIMIWWL